MAIPSFVSQSGRSESVGDLTPLMPDHQADDVLLCIVEAANEPIVLGADQGFVEVANSPQGTGTAGGTSATNLAVYWKRAASGAETAPTITDPGNHAIATVASFRGCITTGDPWDITAGDALDTATSVCTVPGGTTTVAECLIVAIGTSRFDNSVGQLGSWANPDLANVTEIVDHGTNLGNGGSIGAATGEKAVAGAFSATTAALNNAAQQARLMIALKPPTPSGGAAPPETWYYRTTAQGAHFG